MAAPLKLRIHAVSGRNLAAKDLNGKSDPFLNIKLLDVLGSDTGMPTHQTHVCPATLEPRWDDIIEFTLDMSRPASAIVVDCWDKDVFGRDFMGTLTLPLDEFVFNSHGPVVFPGDAPPAPPPEQNGEKSNGADASAPQKHRASWLPSLGGMLSRGSSANPRLPFSKSVPRWIPLQRRRAKDDISGELEINIGLVLPSDDADAHDYFVALVGEELAAAVAWHQQPVVRPSLEPSVSASTAANTVKAPTAIPSTVHDPIIGVVFLDILSAVHLPKYKTLLGASFDMDPFVVITSGRRTFRTRTIRHSLSPQWDERVLFPVRNSEMAHPIRFAVYDFDIGSGNKSICAAELAMSELIKDAECVSDKKPAFMEDAKVEDQRTMVEKQLLLAIDTRDKRTNLEVEQARLNVRSGFVSVVHLRRQFWLTLAKQYDADGNNYINVHELQALLDALESTVQEETMIGWFTQHGKDAENGGEITFEQLADSLEAFTMDPNGIRLMLQHRASVRCRQHDKRRGWLRSVKPAAALSNGTKEQIDMHAADAEEEDLVQEDGVLVQELICVMKCPICGEPTERHRTAEESVTHFAICLREHPEKVNRVIMSDFITEADAQRKWYLRLVKYVSYGGYDVGKNNANVLVLDRATGRIVEERMPIYIRMGIRLMYKSIGSKSAVNSRAIKRVLKNLSVKQGKKYSSPESTAEIQPFVNFHKLDLEESLEPIESFKNFNEFFYRKLKSGARPLANPDDPSALVSVADARCMFFPQIDQSKDIWIKGQGFSVERLLADSKLAKFFEEGSLAIFRLAPQDYHRFHVPADGVMSKPKSIEGEYYTVNPMAIRSSLDVYGENTRVVSVLDSPQFGKIAYVSIGAMMVGSTIITSQPGEPVCRGEEHGYFAFGGSTIVLLFEKGAIEFDSDLVKNSSEALETLLKMGNSVGRATGAKTLVSNKKGKIFAFLE